jgi:hypothetical protein
VFSRARSIRFEIVRMDSRIVGGDALPLQHATLDHKVGDVAGDIPGCEEASPP